VLCFCADFITVYCKGMRAQMIPRNVFRIGNGHFLANPALLISQALPRQPRPLMQAKILPNLELEVRGMMRCTLFASARSAERILQRVCSPCVRAERPKHEPEEDVNPLVVFTSFLYVIQRAHRELDVDGVPKCSRSEAVTAGEVWQWLQLMVGEPTARYYSAHASRSDALVGFIIDKLARAATGELNRARMAVAEVATEVVLADGRRVALSTANFVLTLANWAAGEGVDKDPPSATADDVADRPSREPTIVSPPARPDAARTIGTPLSSPFPVTGAATTLNDARSWPLRVCVSVSDCVSVRAGKACSSLIASGGNPSPAGPIVGHEAAAVKASLAKAMQQFRTAENTEQSAKGLKCAAQTSLSLLAALSVFNSDAVSLLAGVPGFRRAGEKLSIATVFKQLRQANYVSDELAQPARGGAATYRTSCTTYVGVGLAIAAASFAVEQAPVGGRDACALTTWRMIDRATREQQCTAINLGSSVATLAIQHRNNCDDSLAANEVLAALTDPHWNCASFLCTRVTNLDLQLTWDTTLEAFKLTDASIASLRPVVAMILIAVDERRAQGVRASRSREAVKADMMLCIREQAALEDWLRCNSGRVISEARLSLQSKQIGTVVGAA
jgi:hypothetical protein